MTVSIPDNEPERLAALKGFEILDTPPEEAFDRITRTVAAFLDVPIALVSLVDESRQWFKSRHGLDAGETPRDIAFCAHAILDDQVLVVDDATKDKRFADNPLVSGEPNIRFYAGAPLCTRDGFRLGTLCAIDYEPRELTKAQEQVLSDLAQVVVDEMELRFATQKSMDSQVRTLKESEAKLREILENSPVGVAIVSHADDDNQVTGKRLFVNSAFVQMFGGASSEEMIEAEISDSWVDLDQLHAVEKLMKNRDDLVDLEVLRRRRDGTEWWALMNSRPISFEGRACTMVWHFDMTERKRAEEALRESENLLNSIIENVPVGLLIKNADHVVERPNSTYLKWYGFDADTMVGVRSDQIEDFQTAEEAEAMNAQEREVLTTGRTLTRQVERPFIDSKVHTVKITKFPIYDQQGNITKVGSVSVDLTEQVQAIQAKSEFLANMSHDLRTPLNAVIGFADIIRHQRFGPISEKYQEYAKDIHSSGEFLLSLVNDILDLSAIETGGQLLAKEKVSIADVVTECEAIVDGRIQSFGVDLITKVSKDLPPVYADRRATKQILLNLLSNSIKFTPEGGQITLRATASDEYHFLEVRDTGIGIPADKIATVTEPFVKGESDPHKSQESTGLGLSIVKSLVDLHDGQLSIESEVGKGTTVTVRFPPERTIQLSDQSRSA